MNLCRKLLAMTIKPGQKKSIKNVLKFALKIYLSRRCNGLCASIRLAFVKYDYVPWNLYDITDIEFFIPEYTKENATNLFGAKVNVFTGYWWPIDKWFPRYRFMKWLIKQYK